MDLLRPLAAVVVLATASCAPSQGPAGPGPGARPEGAPAVVTIAAPEKAAPAAAPSAEPPPAVDAPEGGTWRRGPPVSVDAARLGRLFRDTQRVRLAPRAQALLVAELQGLEALLANTPTTSPDRPKLLRRLAEGYVELEAAAERGSPQASQGGKIVIAARLMAAKHYQALWNEYPRFCVSGNSGCGDEALYYRGLEQELGGRLDEARKSYLELVQNFPQSRLVPFAYLAFGEMFFEELSRDPTKGPVAQQCYEEVLKYPPGHPDPQGYAQYQLGRVLLARGDQGRARDAFRRALLWTGSHAGAPGAGELGDAVRREQP